MINCFCTNGLLKYLLWYVTYTTITMYMYALLLLYKYICLVNKNDNIHKNEVQYIR